MDGKKILIVSHNPITTYESMGKTMLQLFFAFKKENLCQLYIYPTMPDIDRCDSYFRVTDKDVLKSFLRFGKVNGHKICKEKISENNDSMFEEKKDESLYRNRKNKTPSRMLMRELIWKFSHWYNRSLKNWLKEQNPDVIFVAPGTGIFLYRIALKIAKERKIPIVTYLCDDYYFVKDTNSCLRKIHTAWLRRFTGKLLSHSAHVICICNELKKRFAQRFSVPTTTIMTGSSRPIKAFPLKRPAPESITYMGNIRCNRYFSLAKIGEALQRFNCRYDKDYKLKIYTSENNDEILSHLKKVPSIELCGFVTGKAYDNAFGEAQLLLHTEAFDESSIDLVKDSVSTKIADCLGSGVCMLAYGPASVASMQHLLSNSCAICVTDEAEISTALETVFLDEKTRKETVVRALNTALSFHNSEKNSQRLLEIMENV